ncbi:MAG: HNH endonuclease [Nanoarchaeota archaeon]|nr:HNH endonuclease [Nanoarchaeota archaeon]
MKHDTNLKKRKNLSPKKQKELLRRNAGVCCICRERGLGINFHHIDGNPSNDKLENIAVLCLREHDQHHRPQKYTIPNHLELGAKEIKKKKEEWERFVKEASKKNTKVLAVLNVFGNYENIHSMKLLFQWENKIIIERVYHLLSGPVENWIDRAFDERSWLGKNIQLVLIDEPLSVEHCPCCQNSYSTTINPNRAKKLTASDWKERSICSIYINPKQASLVLVIVYGKKAILNGSLHKCGNFLHYMSDDFEERKEINPKQDVRKQAVDVIQKVLFDWSPGRILICTGNHDKPHLIKDLLLPKCWEK